MSPTIDSRESSSRKADGLEYGNLSEKRCAESKSWIIASRSRSAAAPRLPPRSAVLRQAVLSFSLSLVFAFSQIAQSKSSGRASIDVNTLRAAFKRSWTRVSAAFSSIFISPLSIASIKSCVPPRVSVTSSREARSAVRIRRSEIESDPPNSASSKRSQVSRFSG